MIQGCSLSADSLTLKFDMAGRKLSVRAYNQSNSGLSATSVRVAGATTADDATWHPVHIALGASPGTVKVDLSSLPKGAKPDAVRYAWGGTSGANIDDVSCCEGDGIATPCLPVQCPLLAPEPLAPFGALPVDPFLAELVGGKCLCPEPQLCSA